MKAKIGQLVLLFGLFVALPGAFNVAVLHHPQLWLLTAVGVAGTFFQPDYGAADLGPADDRLTAAQIIWSIYAVVLGSVLEATFLRYPDSYAWTWLTTVALASMVAGLVLRSWAFVVLGRFFTWHVEVLPAHELVERGPYRFVRHPGYVGAALTYVATPVFLGAWWTLALSLVLLPWAWFRRVRLEERRLIDSLGEPYRDYMRRVGGFVPRPCSSPRQPPEP